MGHRYLNSANAGSEVSPYDTVAGAASSLAQILALNGGANAVVCATENIYVINTHNETNIAPSATLTWTSPSTAPQVPLKVICVTNLTTPTTLSTGAIFNLSTNYNARIDGSFYFDGPVLTASYTNSGCAFILGYTTAGPYSQTFENCTFNTHPTSSSPSFKLFNSTGQYGVTESSLTLKDSTINCATAFAAFTVQGLGNIYINKLSIDPASSATPESIFSLLSNTQAQIRVTNSDLTGKGWTYLVDSTATTGQLGDIFLRNCALPSGTSWLKGSPSTPSHVLTITAVNCSSADSWTAHEYVNERTGVCSVNTSVYTNTSPAEMSSSAGDTYSIKMVTTADVSRFLPLLSEWMCVWNDAADYTPSVEVLVSGASAALNSDELWIEVDYNSGTDSPLGTRLTTLPGVLTAGSAVADGTTTWTGATGWDHKLSTAQITPDKPGYVWIRVALAKPSTTIYVNPARP